MTSVYPGTLDAFTNPAGTSILNSPSHSSQHTDANDAIENIQGVIGTTAGTSIAKNFAVGDFATRINASNVMQQRVSGTVDNAVLGTPSISNGTATSTVLNSNTVGTPTVTGGTWTSGTLNSATLGTPTIADFTNATHAHTSNATGGTVSHTSLSNIGSNTHAQIDTHIAATGTAVHGLGNMAVQNSSAISVTGGTVTATTLGTNTIIGGTATSTVFNTNTIGTPTITGGSFSSGTINNPVIGTQSSTGGTLSSVTVNSATLGSPSITSGTLTSSVINGATLGSPSITSGTSTSHVGNAMTLGSPSITSGTLTSSVINNATLGTPSVTGGTVTSSLLGTNTITGGTATSTVLNSNTMGTPTITGGTWTSGTVNSSVVGTPNITGGTATSLSPLDVVATDLKLSTASKAGVFNGGFELSPGTTATSTANRWIDNSAGGSTTNDAYGWAYQTQSATASIGFDNTVSHSGKNSIKMIVTAAGGGKAARLTHTAVTLPGTSMSVSEVTKYGIPIKASTKYIYKVWVKTDAITAVASGGAYINTCEYPSAGGSNLTNVASTYITGTNDWYLVTGVFTSNASSGYFFIQPSIIFETGTAWFDDISLEEIVTDTTFTGKTVEKIRITPTAVTSTDNIDQSLDTGGAYANTYALTTAINEGATHIQTFTPTKKYTTQIGVWVVAKGTGNWTLVVHDASNNVLASYTIANASLTNGAFNYFNVPNIWSSGALHFHVYSTVADGTVKVNTSNDLETASFIQYYAKKSETYSQIVNGIKTELKADKDGILTGAIIDLDNGKYLYNSGLLTTEANALAICNNIFSAENSGATPGGEMFIGVNGWDFQSPANYGLMSGDANSVNRRFIIKVNTCLPIKHLSLKTTGFSGGTTLNRLEISLDNINWTTIFTEQNTGVNTRTNETDLVNGLSSFYLRYGKSSGDAYQYTTLSELGIYANIDTSKIQTGLFYPIGTNQFAETVTLPSVATRAYFRLAKFTNEYGVVVPAIEFTDTTPATIGYIPLKLDNSQETNPSIRVLSTTTNYQVSGTGSSDGGYVLNDGEYMTFTSTTSTIKFDYQVGAGTTTFSNITKNTIYYSSNGEGNDSTQDPSHQMSVDLGIRQQGTLQRQNDIGEEVQLVRKGIADTQQLVRNSGLIIGVDVGTTDDYAITLSDFTGYKTGLQVIFRANTANTTGATLNINGLGAIAIVKAVSTALSTNDILALMYCYCIYDGTNFVLLNPRAL